MTRVMARVQYLGENYCGFQVQPNGITIQEVLEKTLSQLLNQDIKVTASGRTDTGVHAIGQIIHFDIEGNFPIGRIPYAASALLPDNISITQAHAVDASFHARYSAKKKKYGYKIYLNKINSPFLASRAYQCPYQLDLEIMKLAASSLVGEHDFRAFMSSGSSVGNTLRTIYSIEINGANNIGSQPLVYKNPHIITNEEDWGNARKSSDNLCRNSIGDIDKVSNCNGNNCLSTTEKVSGNSTLNYEMLNKGVADNKPYSIIDNVFIKDNVVEIIVTGNGFLYNMVRIIVGTLVDIGRGRLPLNTIDRMLKIGDRSLGGATAPSCGLYLLDVEYDELR